jgi:hypothetical protein
MFQVKVFILIPVLDQLATFYLLQKSGQHFIFSCSELSFLHNKNFILNYAQN